MGGTESRRDDQRAPVTRLPTTSLGFPGRGRMIEVSEESNELIPTALVQFSERLFCYMNVKQFWTLF